MSTTIKRVALVAVAALGLSLVSVAPSNAAINSDTLTLSAATAAQTTAETFTATSAVATLSFLGAVGDSASVTAALVSGPAGNTALPYLRLTETASATINETNTILVGNVTGPNTAVRVSADSASKVTTAKFAVYLGVAGTPVTAPTVAGTYVVRLTPASVGGSGALLGAAAQTLTITVTTAAAQDKTVDVAKSTSIINSGETNTATVDATVTGSMAVPAAGATNDAAAGTIAVTLKNAADAAVSDSYTALILSGPGLLGSGAQSTTHSFAATGRAITVKNGDVVGVFPDGSSGVSKIEIRTAAGVLIATETVTFFGAIASIVATVVKPVIGVRAETGVITAVAKDAAGTTITAPTLFITSGTTGTISQSYASATSSAAGVATFALTGVKAGTASIVVSNGNTAALSTVSAAAVSVRVGGAAAEKDGLLVAPDKLSYAPGEVVTLTITPTDAAGLTLADDTYTVFTSTGITTSHQLTNANSTGVALPAGTTVHNGGVDGTGTKSGVAVYKFYAPNIEGDVTLSWTRSTGYVTAANDSVKGSVVLSISSPGAAAATDAANEATDAANAATDAALAAAEAADAATTAAQEASDAVAALSESVTKLIAGLQAQIKSLAAVVAKIAKKVKA